MKSGWSFQSSKYSRLSDDRQQTAVRVSDVGRKISVQRLEPRMRRPPFLEPGGQRAVRRVEEDEIRFARMHAHFQNALPEVARRDRLDDFARGGVLEIPRIVRVFVAHRSLDFLHEGVREVDPVVQVQSLQVLVARGFAHFDEGNDVGVVRVEKRSVGAASGRALTVGEAGRVVDLEVRHHAHALFVGVADAHVNADAASGHGKAVHFAQRLDETSALSAM